MKTPAPENFKEAGNEFLSFYAISPKLPDVDYLQQILAAYTNLPYENVSKIIKLNNHFTSEDRIRLPDEVIADHEQFRLGGTCFSLTFYLQAILLHQGFSCYPVLADMRNLPNVHCALVVIMSGKKYLIDPGYLLTRPMQISKDNPRLYRTEHTGVELRFDREEERFHLYTFDRSQYKWRYRFLDQPAAPEQFLKYWHESFYKGTMHGIVLTKINPDGMIYMHNDYMRITTPEGQQKQRVKSDYIRVVEDRFGLQGELVERAQEALQRNLALERELGIFKPKEKHATR